MRDSSSRAYKSLNTSFESSLTGFSLLVLAPLSGTRAALMLSFVRSIPGRPSHIDPTKILPQDRFKFCPDTNPFSTLEAATQHTNTITRLKIRRLRNKGHKDYKGEKASVKTFDC
eukprot:1124303-Pelagomonas_calceolata.AAC.1